MTKTELDNDVKFLLTGSSTGTIDFSAADITACENRHYDKITSLIMRVDGRFEFDDNNLTTLPIGTTDLISGQADYTISASDFLEILRVEIKNPSGNGVLLKPISYEDKKGVAMTEWAKTAGTPHSYDKVGNSIILYPTPNYNSTAGLKVYFKRNVSYFIATDTTKEPGFNPQYHRLLSMGAASDYCISNGLTNKLTILSNEITKMETALMEFYSQRNKDDPPKMTLYHEDYGSDIYEGERSVDWHSD